MKIGFFDSGLGGLYMLRAVAKRLPQYDYVFLGDTKNLPYGERSQKQIYKLTADAVEFLFNHNCNLVIVACNTSSAQALRKIQKEFLPKHYPDKKVLGVIRPTVELIRAGDTCILATTETVRAHAYTKELRKLNPKLKVTEIAAPELVPLIESRDFKKLDLVIAKYAKLSGRTKVRNVVLGCTHYAVIKDKFAKKLPKGVKLISQDEILPQKLHDYLKRHPEITGKLSRNKHKTFFVTKLNNQFLTSAKDWFGKKVNLKLARY